MYALLNLQLRAAFIQLMPLFMKTLFGYFCCHNKNNKETKTYFFSDTKFKNASMNEIDNPKRRNSLQSTITKVQLALKKRNSPEFRTNDCSLLTDENFNKELLLPNNNNEKKYGSFEMFCHNDINNKIKKELALFGVSNYKYCLTMFVNIFCILYLLKSKFIFLLKCTEQSCINIVKSLVKIFYYLSFK